MKAKFTLVLFIISCTTLNAQVDKTYTSLEEALKTPDKVFKLDLSSQGLSSLPESIGNLTNLTELDLSKNQLKSLPESIGNLTNLTLLLLGDNKLNSLPESIGNLTNLCDRYITVPLLR